MLNSSSYYGQNSYGQSHPSDMNNYQTRLSNYCQDDTINAFPLAFLNVYFDGDGLPVINLANICAKNCTVLQDDIKMCQEKGKIITLSLGGDVGGSTGLVTFSSDAQAEQFADTVWNLFLGGSTSEARPFGDAVLDGVDLDIEGIPPTGYFAFVNKIRSHTDRANKKYYVTAAPQCPDVLKKPVLYGASFDAVYVLFYNNPWCEASSGTINFDEWDQWARTESPNKDVKIFLGVPASPTAASPASYVDPDTLGELAKSIQDQYSSFGGVVLWDASQAYANKRYDVAIKRALTGATGDVSPETSATAESTSATSLVSTTASSAQSSFSVAEVTSASLSSVVASASSSSESVTTTTTAKLVRRRRQNSLDVE
ncbi:Chitinase 2 [Marasmius tenuissimus]|nr:Chitinase 2 [Marasmius tenuissimus]